MSKSKAKRTTTEVLKAAIEQNGLTRSQISKDTGIAQATLMRFVRSEASLRLDKADVLAGYLGLELRVLSSKAARWHGTMERVSRMCGVIPLSERLLLDAIARYR